MTAETILIVDDDELVRTGLALDLEHEGYQVFAAASAEEALGYLRDNEIHLILSDLVMAEMDGINLLERVRTHLPHIGFIIITGHGTVDRALEAMRRGANDFVQKPADSDVIRNRVRAVLDEARLRSSMLSDRQRQQERREAMQKRLIRDQRMVSLGRLADGVSDYLAGVLEPMFRCAAEMDEMLPADHPFRKHAEAIAQSERKARSFIQDLHTIGQGTDEGQVPVSLDKVIGTFLESASMQAMRALAPALRLLYEPEEQVSEIQGAPDQLGAMIHNLLAHSMEGMPDGGLLRIRLYGEQVDPEEHKELEGGGGAYVALEVEDTAPEPPANDMDLIFEPFQPRTVNGAITSSGLGLSVVYRVVQAHHGFIDVRSERGHGTTYVLHFPVSPAAGIQQPVTATGMAGSETVLVLDDNDTHRQAAVTMLEDLGYEVVTASSGDEALAYFQSEKPVGARQRIDLAVLDLVLGDACDGLEVYKKILHYSPEQRAILVSGFAEFGRIIEARKMGMGRYVQKPYEQSALGRAVRAELDRERAS